MIDVEHAVIIDVEATPARTYNEVAATRTMIDRTEKAFGVKPERLPADTAFTPGHALVNSTPARTSPIVASLRDASLANRRQKF
jgi:hypothetical protein